MTKSFLLIEKRSPMNLLNKWMTGRYGINDTLNKHLMFLLMIVLLLNLFNSSILLRGLIVLFLILIYGRLFSKNQLKRAKELKWYQGVVKQVGQPFHRIKLSKTHKVLRCSICHQSMKVPRHKGQIEVTCPKCYHKERMRS